MHVSMNHVMSGAVDVVDYTTWIKQSSITNYNKNRTRTFCLEKKIWKASEKNPQICLE